MINGSGRSLPLLFVGDAFAFILSLHVTLWVRYAEFPSAETLAPFIVPFTFLIVVWLLIFYAAGLYSKRITLFPSRFPDALIKTQVVNIAIAALFFFLRPEFGLAPKTILALYLLVSLFLIALWRLALYPKLSANPRRERALLFAEGVEAEELRAQVNGNPRYGIEFVDISHAGILPENFSEEVRKQHISLLVVEPLYAPARKYEQHMYALTQSSPRIQLASFEDVYEEVFDRIPLSRLGHSWFLKNVSPATPFIYAFSKRLIDIAGGIVMGIITIAIAPFIWIANLVEGGGSLFLTQERLGERGARMYAYKFRSMRQNKSASGEWTTEEKKDNPITKVGSFLRRTSLDEFPQFINVLQGELSLIGPRNDILGLGKRLAEALPYYEARYLVKPGLTGWAQINQQYEQGNVSPQSVAETRVRLSYDFYYLKHRSLGLDVVIALKTIKRMFFRVSTW